MSDQLDKLTGLLKKDPTLAARTFVDIFDILLTNAETSLRALKEPSEELRVHVDTATQLAARLGLGLTGDRRIEDYGARTKPDYDNSFNSVDFRTAREEIINLGVSLLSDSPVTIKRLNALRSKVLDIHPVRDGTPAATRANAKPVAT